MSKDHHAEGEKDGARGKYDPPHSITPLDHAVHSPATAAAVFLQTVQNPRNAYRRIAPHGETIQL